MIKQQLCTNDKLSYIKQNISQYPAYIRNHIKQNQQNLNQTKIQTLYRALQPCISHIHWQSPNENNLYPVILILAPLIITQTKTELAIKSKNNVAIINTDKKNEGKVQYGVNCKLVTWLQSGGARCVVMKYKIYSSQSDIQKQIHKFIKISHCSVIANIPYDQANKHEHQLNKKWMQLFMNAVKKQQSYHVLFIGDSSRYAIKMINQNQNTTPINVVAKQQNGQSDISVDFKNNLFIGLNLETRLYLQTLSKINYPSLTISNPFEQLNKCGIDVSVWCEINKNNCVVKIPLVLQQNQNMSINLKDNHIYMIVAEQPFGLSQCPQVLQFWHCCISNFVDRAKKIKKDVDEKKVQKNYVGHWFITPDKRYYKHTQ